MRKLSNIASRIFFQYSTNLINLAVSKRFLLQEDLYTVTQLKRFKVMDFYQKFRSCLKKNSGHDNQNQRQNYNIQPLKKSKFKGFRIINTFFKTYFKIWIIIFLFQFLLTIFIIVTPILSDEIMKLVRIHSKNWKNIIQILLLIFIQKGIKTILSVHLDYYEYTVGSNFYGQLTTAIFQKSLINQISEEEIRGKVVNLLEDDSYRLINFSFFLMSVIFIPLQLIYGIGLIIWYLGIQFFLYNLYILIGYFIICILLIFIDRKLNIELMKRKDFRINKTFQYIKLIEKHEEMRNQNISGNQQQQPSIRKKQIYEQEQLIFRECLKLRERQISQQKKLFSLQILTKFFSSLVYSLLLSVSLLSLHETTDINLVFTILLLFGQLKYPLVQLPNIISNFIQNYVSICRIEQFLEKSYQQTQNNQNNNSLEQYYKININQSILQTSQERNQIKQLLLQKKQLPQKILPSNSQNPKSAFIKVWKSQKQAVITQESMKDYSYLKPQFLFLQYNKNITENILFYHPLNSSLFQSIKKATGLDQYNQETMTLVSYLQLPPKLKLKLIIAKNLYVSRSMVIDVNLMKEVDQVFTQEQKHQLFTKILQGVQQAKLYLPKQQNTRKQKKYKFIKNQESNFITHSQYQNIINKNNQQEQSNRIFSLIKSKQELLQKYESKSIGNVEFVKYMIIYLKISSATKWGILFLVFAIGGQLCLVFSKNLIKNLTKKDNFLLKFASIEFFSLYADICIIFPMAAIIILSIKASQNSYPLILMQVRPYLQKFKFSALINRLSNDLKFFDKNIALSSLDLVNSILSIGSNVSICLITIISIRKQWSILMVGIIIFIFIIMMILNRRFMWARRECARIQAVSRSPFLIHFYQCMAGRQQIFKYNKQEQVKLEHIRFVDEIVRNHLLGINLENWFEMRLVFLSLFVSLVTVGFTIILDLDVILTGLILSYTLTLDDLFQTLFTNIITFQKTSISVQRYFDLFRSSNSKNALKLN